MSKDHFTHRFDEESRLVMIEYSSDRYDVTYLTREGRDEDGNWRWFCNNTDTYKSFSEAKSGFNRRKISADPFRNVS